MKIDRRIFLKIMAGTIGSTAIGLDSFVLEPSNVEENYYRIETNKLKNKLRIVQISDLHLDEDTRRDYVPQMINNRNPDLILMTGDYLNSSKNINHRKKLEGFVNSLKSKYGVYACFGNWDEGTEKELFKNTQVKCLTDETIELKVDNDNIQLTGLEFAWQYYPELILNKIFRGNNKSSYNILLYHSPDLAEQKIVVENTDLYLCGHTHGGTVRIPFMKMFEDEKTRGKFPYMGAIVTPPSKFGRKYDAGLYSLDKMSLYVNKGIGNLENFPIRLICKPEIATFDIGSKNSLPDKKYLFPSNL